MVEKIVRPLIAVALVVLLLGTQCIMMAASAEMGDSGIQTSVLAFDTHSMLVEAVVDHYEVQSANDAYHTVQIDGTVQTTEPGKPQIPQYTVMLGVPTLAGLTLQVVDIDYEMVSGIRLPLAPSLKRPTVENLYDAEEVNLFQEVAATTVVALGADEYYPAQPAALGASGQIRDQAVVAVQFFPAQYNAAMSSIRLYQRIQVRISWEPSAAPRAVSTRTTHAAFEEMLAHTLSNYAALERPAMAVPAAHLDGARAGPAAQNVTQRWKMGVEQDGLYRLRPADLAAQGIDPATIDPRTLHVTNQGKAVSIFVLGEGDGSFDNGDALFFYGTALKGNLYTTRNIYWLSWGEGDGERVATRSVSPGASALAANHFPTSIHAEKDTDYWGLMTNGEGEDHWFWSGRLDANSADLPAFRDYALTLPNISPEGQMATVRVRLKGRTSLSHRTRIYLNGIQIDEQTWAGQVVFDHTISVDYDLLKAGENKVRVEVLETDAAVNQVYVNWIEIDYWDTYVAEAGQLTFAAPGAGHYRFTATNLRDSDLQLWNITDPAKPVRGTGGVVQVQGGGFTLTFADSAGAATRYIVVDEQALLSPASLAIDEPSNWKSSGNGADYIVITHADFYANALALANHRQSQGLRVATVKVDDLYDEFNHGIFNPAAIRDFLAYAYGNWQASAPLYVLLVGDAYYDYKDNTGTSTRNFVPTQLVETNTSGEIASDNWFATVAGNDVLPDLMLGRLSVTTAAEASAVVTKNIGYDDLPGNERWNQRALLVADNDEVTFETTSNLLAAEFPFDYTVDKIYASAYPPGNLTSDLKGAINGGSVLVNYIGHGAISRWGTWSGGEMFTSSDMGALANGAKLPVFTIANCLNGFFNAPKTSVSGAETLQRLASGGAAGIWAPTGLGYPSGHRVLMQELYEAIFEDDLTRMGAATTAAKVAAFAHSSAWGELVETYVYFGDPAMALAIPANAPYLAESQPAAGDTGVPVDSAIALHFSKPMAQVDIVLRDSKGTVLPLMLAATEFEETFWVYTHSGLQHGQTYTISVSGSDQQNTPILSGPVPAEFTFTVTSSEGNELNLYLPAIQR